MSAAAFQTVIVPFDFSASARAALTYAAGWAKQNQSQVVLVHGMVVPAVKPLSPAYGADDIHAGLQAHLEKRLEEYMTPDFRPQVVIRSGHVDMWVNEVAKAYPSPVILLSRHGWSGKQEGIGRTAKRILHQADVPVWLLAASEPTGTHIMAAVAMDPNDMPVIRTAIALSEEWQAPVALVHVFDTMAAFGYFQEVGWQPTPTDINATAQATEAELNRVVSQVSQAAIKPEVKVLAGTPATVLWQEAERIGSKVVICGRHVHGAWARLLLGSTTDVLARDLPSHLLLIP